MSSVDETPGSPLSINHLMLTLQRGGKAANDAFARENKNEDDQKVLEDTIMIMAALRKQAPFKGTGKTKRDLQGVLKGIKRLEMPQGDWVQDSWKKSEHRCKPKSAVTRKHKHQPVSRDKIDLSAPGGGGWGGGSGWGGGGGGGVGGGGGEFESQQEEKEEEDAEEDGEV
jgi:uncharacterized membrane protein YgcG